MGVQGFVKKIIKQIESSPVVLCYDNVLKNIESTFLSALDIHNVQVSTLGVLLLLTEGKSNPTELSEVALAGLFHDVGLTGLPVILGDMHLAGKDDFKPTDLEVYKTHVGLSIEALKSSFPNVGATVSKMIELHHENFDGSGFKGISGNFMPHGSRILRIADDIAVMIGSSKQSLTVKDALSKLMQANLLKYDLSIVQKVSDSYMSMGIEI